MKQLKKFSKDDLDIFVETASNIQASGRALHGSFWLLRIGRRHAVNFRDVLLTEDRRGPL